MATKRKLSFAEHMRFTLNSFSHNVAAYCARVKLTKPEKTILADYMNGHVSLHTLTTAMLEKMLKNSNSKYQFKNAYALELVAYNLHEHNRDTLLKLFKESTLKKWLTEFSIMSRPMQEIYLQHFGYTVFEGSNLPSVQGGIDLTGRVMPGKPRTAKEAAEDARNMGLLRDSVGKGKSIVVTKDSDDDTDEPVEVAKDFRTQQHRSVVASDDEGKVTAASYFSAHVMRRTGEALQDMFTDMLNYHHDEKVPYLFREFTKSPLSRIMADFWWESFVFEYVDFKGDDNTLKVSCKHFDIYISHKELTFVDKWDTGEVSYTIPASDEQELRMEQAEYFFHTWDADRIKKVFQHIGFETEDKLIAASQPLELKRVPSGPQAIMEFRKNDLPIVWDGASYSVYSTLEEMCDGIRGVVITKNAVDFAVCIGGIEYTTFIVSDGPVKRYVMPTASARDFFSEYTDHMGFSDGAHELRKHGFALDLNRDRAVLRFIDDSNHESEIIAYV